MTGDEQQERKELRLGLDSVVGMDLEVFIRMVVRESVRLAWDEHSKSCPIVPRVDKIEVTVHDLSETTTKLGMRLYAILGALSAGGGVVGALASKLLGG